MTGSCIYAYIWEQNEHTQKNFRKLPITSPSLTSVSTCGYYVIGDYELKFEILSLLLVAQVHLYKSISSVSGHQHFAGDTALILHNQSINHWPKVDWNSKRCSFHLQILLLTVPWILKCDSVLLQMDTMELNTIWINSCPQFQMKSYTVTLHIPDTQNPWLVLEIFISRALKQLSVNRTVYNLIGPAVISNLPKDIPNAHHNRILFYFLTLKIEKKM